MKKHKNMIRTFMFLAVLAAVLLYCQTEITGSSTGGKPAEQSNYPVPNGESVAVAQVASAILTKMHYQKKEINLENSVKFFHAYLESLDPLRMFFTKEKILEWESQAPHLIKNLLDGRPTFAYQVYHHYMDQLKKYQKFVNDINISEDDLQGNETMELDRTKVSWAKNQAELEHIWRKKVLNDVILLKIIDRIEKEKAAENPKKAVSKWKKASPLAQVKKRVQQFVTEEISANAITVIEHYLNALSGLYDPHTAYMAPSTEEDFNMHMSLSLYGIGAVLSPADDGSTRIVKIMPGGPAMKNGQLHAEDRIIAVAQGNQEPVDVIDMPLKKVVSLIRGPAGTEVVITALDSKDGAGGTPKTVRLIREEIELKESEAKSEVREIKGIDGKKSRIAIISLPSFYFDFEGAIAGKKDYKSSVKDVKNLLRKIRSEGKIDALVIDLRFNGGGSLREAIKLTGLFIPEGPVVQVLEGDGSLSVESDNDGGWVEYDGPLIVLTNKFSASSSEIFAGAIQDYGRGIVVGDVKTHGKGTVQTVVDINEFFRPLGLKYNGGSIKLTKSKFYRINGHSTQLRGVTPDIVIPSYSDVLESGEDSLKNPMPWDEIRPAIKMKKNHLPAKVSILAERSKQRIVKSNDFIELNKDMERFRKNKEKKITSLNFNIRWKEYQEQKRIMKKQEEIINQENDDDVDDPKKKKKDFLLDEIVRIAADYAEMTP